MGGEDEMGLVKDLPDGLRRDIKRFLCLDLIKKVTQYSTILNGNATPDFISFFSIVNVAGSIIPQLG